VLNGTTDRGRSDAGEDTNVWGIWLEGDFHDYRFIAFREAPVGEHVTAAGVSSAGRARTESHVRARACSSRVWVSSSLASAERRGTSTSTSTSMRRRLSGEWVAGLVRCRCAAAADRRGWDDLVREVGGLISMVARAHRLSDDDADAADVAQATWLKLFEHVGDVRDPARIGGWLATTACRECLRVLRDGGKYVPFGDDAPEQDSPGAPLMERLLVVECNRALWRGFERLRHRDQLLLRSPVAGPRPSYERIAAALGMPVRSIGPARARALRRLRREVARVRTPAVANGLVRGARDVSTV
jgi:RNA polymerase sigma factor (sigma-70 family)